MKFSPRKNRSREIRRRNIPCDSLKDPFRERGERGPGQTTSSRPTTRRGAARGRDSVTPAAGAVPAVYVTRVLHKGTTRSVRCTRRHACEGSAMLIVERHTNEHARPRARFTYMKIIAKCTRVGLFSSHRPCTAFLINFFFAFFLYFLFFFRRGPRFLRARIIPVYLLLTT